MITLLRNSLKDGGMTTIVWIAVGSMIIGSALPLVMKKNSEEWALRINGAEVPYATYAAELAMVRDYITMLRAQYGQFAEYLLQSMGFNDPQSMTMQQLITQQLMVYGYKAQGIIIGQESINDKLADTKFIEESCGDLLPAFLYKDNKIDNNILKLYLQQRAMSIDQLQERLQERIGTVFMQQAVESLAYIPIQSVANKLAIHGATKDIALIRIPLADYQKTVSAELTDDQIKAFYSKENARANRYYTSEQRSGSIWEFDASGFGIAIDTAAIENYYEENKTIRYQKEASKVTVRALGFATREAAESAHKALVDNSVSFSDLAQEHPFNEESAANNGLLMPIIRGTGDRIIEKAAFILAENGDLSPVIEHNNRFVLIERVSKIDPIFTPLSKVQDEIKKQLQQAAFKEKCLYEMQKLVKTNDADAIAEFIKNHKGKNSTYQNIALNDAKTDAQKNLFAIEDGSYSALGSGDYCYIVHLKTTTPALLQPYDVVSHAVRTDLIEDRAKQALSQASLDFNHAIATKGIHEAARDYGFSVSNYTLKGTADGAQTTELRNKYGLDTNTLNALEKIGTTTINEHKGDVIIAALEGVKPVTDTLSASIEKDIIQGMVKQDRQTIVAGYIASLYRDATIEKNDILALLDKENTI